MNLDLELMIGMYNEKERRLRELKLEFDLVETALLKEANTKLAMSQMLSNFTVENFTNHMATFLDGDKIYNVSRSTIAGKDYKTSKVVYRFTYCDRELYIVVPVEIFHVHEININTLGLISVCCSMSNSTTSITIGYASNMVELGDIIKSTRGKTCEDIIKDSIMRLSEYTGGNNA